MFTMEIWDAFIIKHAKNEKPLPIIPRLEGLSCHRLEKLRKILADEKKMWCYLAPASRSYFEMLRLPGYGLEPSWRWSLHPWLSRVDDAHFAVCRFLSFEMDELMKLLSVEDVLHGFRHLNGFEQAQRQLLVSHRLIKKPIPNRLTQNALSGSSSFEEMSNSE